MIEKLFIYTDDYGAISPSKFELVQKINEIIEWINKQEGGKDEGIV